MFRNLVHFAFLPSHSAFCILHSALRLRPARAKRSAGFSLVELLVSLLLLIIVAVGWFKIMNATSPYKEAQKRAAIELAAGILDVFFPGETKSLPLGYYRFVYDEANNQFEGVPADERQSFPSSCFPADSTICYTLRYRMGYVYYRNGDRANNATAYDPVTESERSEKWRTFSEELERVSDEYQFNPYVVEIRLFESRYSKEPFAVFDQLVGYKNKADNLGGY